MRVLLSSIFQASTACDIHKRAGGILVAMLVLLGLHAVPSNAQPPARRTVIHPGRLLDVRTGQMHTGQAIVIEGDRITQIVSASEIKPADGDVAIDLPDATLLPGLIDMHTHLTMELSSLGYTGLGISTAREALHAGRQFAHARDERTASERCHRHAGEYRRLQAADAFAHAGGLPFAA